MKDNTMHLNLDELLDNADWVNRVARSLVYDRGLADDVAQETWLAALKKQPQEIQNPRGWLGGVARNISRALLRSQTRREARDRAAAKPEASVDPEDVTERAALQRRVADLVLELEEPFRTTLLLRFFDGLSPKEISQQMGVPVDTVYSRQSRALAHLRKKLDSEFGKREAWGMALLPLARLVHTVPAGAVAMKGIVAATFLLGACLFFAWPDSKPPIDFAQQAEEASRQKAAATVQATPESAERSRIPANVETGMEALAGTRVLGLVLDAKGVPVSEVPMGFFNSELAAFMQNVGVAAVVGKIPKLAFGDANAAPGTTYSWKASASWKPSASAIGMTQEERKKDPWGFIGLGRPIEMQSGKDGRFELRISEAGILRPMPFGRRLIASKKNAEESGTVQCTFIIAPSVEVQGVVVNEAGNAVPGASIHFRPPHVAALDLPEPILEGLTSEAQPMFEFESADQDGRFHLFDVPQSELTHIEVSATGYQPYSAPLAEVAIHDARIVLNRAIEKNASRPKQIIAGRVIDESGSGVVDARIDFGQWVTTSDRTGAFRMEIDEDLRGFYEGRALVGSKQGLRAGVIEAFAEELKRNPEKSKNLLLIMGMPLSISGTILQISGQPAVGVRIAVKEPVFLGTSDQTVEGGFGNKSANNLTDEQGKFRVGNLLDKPYALRIWDGDMRFCYVTDPIPAGAQDIQIRIPENATHRLVRGQIVSRAGKPLPGVPVILGVYTMNVRGHQRYNQRQATTSDSQGRFELHDVPRWESFFAFESAEVFHTRYSLPPDIGNEELRIGLPLRCSLRIVPPETCSLERQYCHIVVLGAEGKRLQVIRRDGNMMSTGDHAPINDGPTLLEVPDEAVEMIYYEGHTQIKRIPFTFEPGKIHTVRL